MAGARALFAPLPRLRAANKGGDGGGESRARFVVVALASGDGRHRFERRKSRRPPCLVTIKPDDRS